MQGPSAEQLIALLHLEPHPREGGFFRETYRAPEESRDLAPRYAGARAHSTAIYYLLTPDTCSALHRLASDEVFHFYLGDPVCMLQLHENGDAKTLILGPDLVGGQHLQTVVPRGVWQGSVLEPDGKFALLGCTVAPGFDFADYEGANRREMLEHFPEVAELIIKLTPE